MHDTYELTEHARESLRTRPVIRMEWGERVLHSLSAWRQTL